MDVTASFASETFWIREVNDLITVTQILSDEAGRQQFLLHHTALSISMKISWRGRLTVVDEQALSPQKNGIQLWRLSVWTRANCLLSLEPGFLIWKMGIMTPATVTEWSDRSRESDSAA